MPVPSPSASHRVRCGGLAGQCAQGGGEGMKKAMILVILGFVLTFVTGPMLIRPVDVLRPVLDAKGQQVYDADGRRKLESDPIGQFMVNWDACAIMAAGGLCIVYGTGSALRRWARGSGKYAP